MRVITAITISAVLLLSCQEAHRNTKLNTVPQSANDTTFDFAYFHIKAPKTWKVVNDDTSPKALDMTMRKQLLTAKDEKINIEYGNSAWDRSERESGYERRADLIGGLPAIIYVPKPDVKGFTGIYIDSAGTMQPVGKYGFSIYTKDLTSDSQEEFWEATKTIKLKPLN